MDTWGISGPTFLVIYGGLLAVAGAAVLAIRRRLSGSSRDSGLAELGTPDLGLYDVAMLKVGDSLVLAAAACRLKETGNVTPGEGGRLTVAGRLPSEPDPVESWAYLTVGKDSPSAHGLLNRAAAEPVLAPIRQRLWALGWLVTPRQGRVIRMQLLWFVPVFGLGIARVIAGANNHRPIGLLDEQARYRPHARWRDDVSRSRGARHAHDPRAALRAVVVVVVLAVLAAACGSGRTSEPRSHQTVTGDPNPVLFGPGRLVSIGGGRSLYLLCEGHGRPTVILEAGFGGTSDNWSEVQPALGRRTRTCAYDRAGLGYSPPIPGVHDAADEIADLGRLLDRARIRPPYVLVGHSYGGLLVRLFAHAHPRQTTGIVLVDAMGHNQDRRLLQIWLAQPASVRRELPRPTANPIDNGVNILAGEALDAKVKTLADTPLIVITRGHLAANDTGTPLPASVRRPAGQLWETMQNELAALSSDSIHVIARRSGHFIQTSAQGQPGVVVAAVLEAIHSALTHTRLPNCLRLFHSPGVQCLQ